MVAMMVHRTIASLLTLLQRQATHMGLHHPSMDSQVRAARLEWLLLPV